MMNKKWIGWKILAGVIFIPALVFLATWVFMLLWNALMTKIFGLPTISYWQGLGLIVLAKFLFCSFSGRKKCRCRCKCRGGKKWERRMKEHFKEHFHERHGRDKEDEHPEEP